MGCETAMAHFVRTFAGGTVGVTRASPRASISCAPTGLHRVYVAQHFVAWAPPGVARWGRSVQI